MRKHFLLVVIIILGWHFLTACQAVEVQEVDAPQPPAPATPVFTPTATTLPQQPANTPTPFEPESLELDEPIFAWDQLDCGDAFCLAAWPGWLERPIGAGGIKMIDRTYPYGSTAGGIYDPHRGVEFQNAYGTPVLAAADGQAVFAGMDDMDKLGPYWQFYGNVVVLRHQGLLTGDRDVYTLYAHLSQIYVDEGDWVNVGAVLGKVGATGAADGPHLHFEVRVDNNDYAHTTNPVLWFPPLDDDEYQGLATLAGVILDRGGTPVPEFSLTLERLSETGEVVAYYYPETYLAVGKNAHPLLGENFAVPDIPAGDYRLALIYGRFYEFFFRLEPGSLGFIKVDLD